MLTVLSKDFSVHEATVRHWNTRLRNAYRMYIYVLYLKAEGYQPWVDQGT